MPHDDADTLETHDAEIEAVHEAECDELDDDEVDEPVVVPAKKKRVLSEERKAALREQLAKVRSKRFEENKPVRDLKNKIQKLKTLTDLQRRDASVRALEKLERLGLEANAQSSPAEEPVEPAPPALVETAYARQCRLARSQIFPSFN